ncbi:GGDEF domain-containing protein [Shumkonia mesophila]|uniref:GGDEF domain-containing protein n=1 Tax=Shumkonia mesophila TaxID=2838854 RepID=UPI002934955B|nr:GGDEF domain-containing protein [Shumkonia mesophila]
MMMIPAIAKVCSLLRRHSPVSDWLLALAWSGLVATSLAGAVRWHDGAENAAAFLVMAGLLHGLLWGAGIGAAVWARRRPNRCAIQSDGTDFSVLSLSGHDALTNLPNRALLLDRLTQSLVRSYRSARRTAVLSIALDGFQAIRESLGHEAGDRVLKEVASRLATVVRQIDTVAQIGNGEFVVILGDVPGPRAAARVANEIVEAVGLPIVLDEEEVTVEANMGIAFFPDDAETPDALLMAAAVAMHEVEKLGVNGFSFAGVGAGAPIPAYAENQRRASLHG